MSHECVFCISSLRIIFRIHFSILFFLIITAKAYTLFFYLSQIEFSDLMNMFADQFIINVKIINFKMQNERENVL